MDVNHPKNIDHRPKRRKDLSFKDSNGIEQCIEIDKALFDAFDGFELDDLSFINEVDRHYEQSDQTEQSLNRRAIQFQESVEETVFRRVEDEALYRAIAQLPEKQRRRLILYYFGDFTYEQIAEMEGCTHPAVMKSTSLALKKIKKFLSEETGGRRWKAFHLFLALCSEWV